MTKEERLLYQKKMKKHEKLGAVKFQKLVFKVEKMKFAVLKRLFPHYIEFFDRQCDKRMEKELEHAKNEMDRERIVKRYQLLKLEARKEHNQERNLNYHINAHNPTEIFDYLEWNKSVHKRGLKKDLILLAISILGISLGQMIFIPLALFELLSAGVDFQCINLQDYNLCKLEIIRPRLESMFQRQVEREMEEHGEAVHMIDSTMKKKAQNGDSRPVQIGDLVEGRSPEELRRLRNYLLSKIEERRREESQMGNTPQADMKARKGA